MTSIDDRAAAAKTRADELVDHNKANAFKELQMLGPTSEAHLQRRLQASGMVFVGERNYFGHFLRTDDVGHRARGSECFVHEDWFHLDNRIFSAGWKAGLNVDGTRGRHLFSGTALQLADRLSSSEPFAD